MHVGTGPKLQNALRNIIDWSIDTISRHLTAKTASAAIASASSPTVPNSHEQSEQQSQQQQVFDPSQHYGNNYAPPTNGNGLPAVPQAETYPMPSHFAYPEPHQTSMPPYATTGMPAFDPNGYPAQDVKPSLEAQLAQMPAQPQQPPPNFLAAFQSPNQSNGFQPAVPQSGPTAWRHFADSMMTNMGTGEYVAPAEQLMALQGGTVNTGQTWPMIAYNTEPQ